MILLSVGIDSADALGPIDQQQTEHGESGVNVLRVRGAAIQEVTPGADAWEVVVSCCSRTRAVPDPSRSRWISVLRPRTDR